MCIRDSPWLWPLGRLTPRSGGPWWAGGVPITSRRGAWRVAIGLLHWPFVPLEGPPADMLGLPQCARWQGAV
eukprot:12720202-Alexandrium_andersonii.AAC.1